MPASSINNTIGKRFIELLSVDSTNNYAMQMVKNGFGAHGDCIFAFEQTAGKGQFNRQWISSKGENIILSIILNTSSLALPQQFLLNMICALSIVELFNKYTTEKIKIKWPNDIYCRDRKAAGILIENVIRGKKWQYAVVGVGANINQVSFPKLEKPPVSLKQITGDDYNVTELAQKFCGILNNNFNLFMAGRKADLLEKYNSQLYKIEETIRLKRSNVFFEGIFKGVNNKGQLIMLEENGIINTYNTGTVEWVVF